MCHSALQYCNNLSETSGNLAGDSTDVSATFQLRLRLLKCASTVKQLNLLIQQT